MASSARVSSANNGVLSTRQLREKYNSYINADPALVESRRWIEVVTGRQFKKDSFRESLADGILLCELIEIVGGVPIGRINRFPTAYAGIDNLNLFFKACEVLGLKKLHLFDVADLQEVTPRRGDSTSSRANETQRRLQNVAITVLWLAKAAQKHGYQGPPLDFSCFNHLLPVVHFHGKKERQTRKRHSLGDLENRKRSAENIPPNKRDRVFDKVDIRDRKEKFRNLEKEAKKEPVALESNRRRSTGGILKRIKDKHWDQEEGIPGHKENKPYNVKKPDPKFHEKQELYNRRDKQAEMDSSMLEDKTRPRGSGSGRVTSPTPISLGRKVEVDLREKQRKFEGLDRQAEQQSAMLSGKTRPVSWAPRDIRPGLKKQNPLDVGFKEKHRNYEQLQRQATTESAVLEGKLRPQFDRVDARPEKVPLTTKADVKLREKRRDFEQRDYQAQREKAILEGNLRLTRGDSKGNRPNRTVEVPKREQIKLDEKKSTFEQLDRQAEQDASILRGEHRPALMETDGWKRSSKVGLPSESNVGLLEKQRTFEAMDYQARKESEILQKNKRKSFERSVREPTPLSTSTRPQVASFQSPSYRQADTSDVRRRNQQERPSRPVSNYYEYSSFQNEYPQSGNVYENTPSEGQVNQVFSEQSLQSAPSYEFESMTYTQNQRDLPVGDEQRAAEERRREYSENARRRYEESRRRRSSGEEPLEIDVSDAKNLSYRDMVRAPRKKSRQTFIRGETDVVVAEEMPWRKEIREVKGIRQLTPEEEQDASYAARPSSPRSELGKVQYLEHVVPPSKRELDSFGSDSETTRGTTEEMPWRKEVKEIKRSPRGEETPAFMSVTQTQPAEMTRIRPWSLKTRDAFVVKQDDKPEEEMPWRKEVRELKTRPRTEDEEDYREDREESPSTDIDSFAAPNLRKFSYKEFINVPRKKRDVFQPDVVNDKDKEEMPWRKEVREIKRSTTDEEDESTTVLAQPVPEHSYRGLASLELVAKPPRKAGDSFVPYEAKQREEMPWRKEVREIKRTITDDEQIPRSSAVNTHSSPEDQRDLRKFSYRDFVVKPRKKSEGFLPTEEKEKEEMPWRKEVRELRARPAEEDQISQSTRSELETTPSHAFYGNSVHPSQDAPYEGTQDLSRSRTYPGRNVQNMSYKDFVCPPSRTSEPQGQGQRRSTKVKDLTQKFANIEAEKDRPKQSGPPSQKSLVDIGELQRLERDMKTRSWHGYPSIDYDEDDDYDARRRQRTRSQEEEVERLRQQHKRENVSGLEELDDVFQDPEGYFDQMQVPPPERSVEKEAGVQYEAPSRKEHDERKEQVVTVRSREDQYGQATLYAARSGDFYQTKPFRDEPSQKYRPSDDRVVVRQSFIQANRVELAEASRSAPEHVKQEYIPNDGSQYVSQHYSSERPYQRDYQKNEPYQPYRDDRREEDKAFSKRSDLNEERCFIEQSEHPQENKRYFPDDYGYRKQNHVPKQNDYWTSRETRSDTREQQVQPKKMPAKNDSGMVFGAPIVVTARPSQQYGKPDVRHQHFGSYDFGASKRRPSYEMKSDTSVVGDDREILPAQDRSYDNRNGAIQADTEKVNNAKNLVLQDIKNHGRKDATEPPEEPAKMARRPQVFGVFARNDPRETQRRDDLHEQQPSELASKEEEDSFPETQRGHLLYLDENEHTDELDRKTVTEKGEDNTWYLDERRPRVEEGYGYENSVSDNAGLHPKVVSMVESRAEQWGSGAFDVSPLKDEQRTGRSRVMNFSDDHGDDVATGNKDENTAPEPVQVDSLERDRKREQKEKEEMLREQLRDAEYREKYRKEFEEKNRKQRENSKYLMSLQMRAALGSDEDADYSQDVETQRDVEQRQSEDYNWKTDEGNDDDLVQVVAEDYWPNEMEKTAEPRINEIDYTGEDDLVRREYRDVEQEARLRKLKAEEEFKAQEADRLEREMAALKQQTQVEEPVIAPAEKAPVEFSINEEALKSFLTEANREEDSYDENRNRHLPKTGISGQIDVFYNDEEYPAKEKLEMRDQQRQYSDNISKPQGEVLPMNGYHHETKDYMDAPAEIVKQNGHFPGHPGADPEVNGFEGYSIYETFIHGESNHVICMSCGTSIEKSPAMYIAELDRYWHVNCFSCVVCRAWFGDEYSPVLQITNSMLHCERCYITSEGERCTEV